ncbi:hypothetical protein O6H91_13G002000 [Diphasiastrum complanatum]|uniref:Uncharacterized protein n=1 Tax=Diphasiastrum complanatum TaxID=34168 RepID=A0ACC2BRG4_DIPCM|nr:hypothetical protein O6H91_Y072700 [Diphasiastrum complanatum]KAJ7532393.1 hypothetical protein O6H91_13G002000 [Diphasiastrum complanatum]
MKPVVLTEELMGLVLRFSKKSGSLWVSWDVHGSEKIYGRKNFTQKARIVFSLCAGILMFTLLLFLLCGLDSAISERPWLSLPRYAPSSLRWTTQRNSHLALGESKEESKLAETTALQGLGTLFRKGTKTMNELVVAHLSENLNIQEFRLFLRTLHRSEVSARADIIFLFPWSPLPLQIRQVIQEEERYFQDLLHLTAKLSVMPEELHENERQTGLDSWHPIQQPVQAEDESVLKASELPSSNKGHKSNVPLSSNSSVSKLNHFMRHEWGSISGYQMAELDPSDTLAAFLESPSIDLRRWFCYQILLGMLKHKYKHVILTRAGKTLILGDALSAVRHNEVLYLTAEDRTWIEEAKGSKHLDVPQNLSITKEDVSDTDEVILAKETRQKASEDTGFLDSQVKLLGSEPAEKAGELNIESKVLATRKLKVSGRQAKKKIKQKSLVTESTSRTKGLMESVYGSAMWLSLEAEEKQNKLLVSNVLMGAMRPVRGLANVMATEIVRIALQRRNKNAFSDQALLNYLIHKSSVLGKKVTDHLLIVSNKESVIHSLSGSQQSDVLVRDCGGMYAVIENYASDALEQFGGSNLAAAIKQDICSSPLESTIYTDCTD